MTNPATHNTPDYPTTLGQIDFTDPAYIVSDALYEIAWHQGLSEDKAIEFHDKHIGRLQ